MACAFFTCKQSTSKDTQEKLNIDKTSKIMLDEAYKALKFKDSSSFFLLNNKIKTFATNHKDAVSMAKVNWNFASYYYKKNIEDSSLYYYNKAHKLYSKTPKIYYATKMLYNIAAIRESIKDYTGSEVLVVKALKEFKIMKRYKNMFHCYNLLEILNGETANYDLSIFYYKKALLLSNRIKDEKGTLIEIVKNNIGLAYHNKGDYNLAKTYFKDALLDADLETKNKKLFAKLTDNLASAYLLDTPSIIDSLAFFKAKKIREKLNDSDGLVMSYMHIADLLLHQKDTINAINNYNKALQISKEINFNLAYLDILKKMSAISDENSVSLLNTYVKLNDS